MLPAIAAALHVPATAVAPGGTANLVISTAQGLTVADGAPSEGDAVSAWDNQVPGAPDLSQADNALRPIVRESIAAGLQMAEFSGARYMAAAASSDDVFFVLVADFPASLAGVRVLVTRDTTQGGTTKPAYAIMLDAV